MVLQFSEVDRLLLSYFRFMTILWMFNVIWSILDFIPLWCTLRMHQKSKFYLLTENYSFLNEC